jgi:3',5'-nucleoside bisphosphate phosphatase
LQKEIILSEVDLHIHTIYSDGIDTPEQLVHKAFSRGLRVIALTDHDSVGGIDDAVSAAAALNLSLEVIPGIELNCDTEHNEIHILGYYIDHHSSLLNEKLKDIRDKRVSRITKILAKFKALGIELTFDEVKAFSQGESLGRPHIARALIQRNLVKDFREAFEKYLKIGAPAYVPRYAFSPAEAIELILQAQGIPVLAHPGLIKDMDLINEVMALGIMGLEVYYSEHNPHQTQFFLELARKNGLLAIGGSDYHGEEIKKHISLGDLYIPWNVYDELRRFNGTRRGAL